MREHPVDEQIITGYLVGVLPEAETERLDEMSLIDDGFMELLLSVEHDLLDSYARGELTGDALDRFKSYYLGSSKGREKVALAETFCQIIDKFSFDPHKGLPRR